MAVEEQKVGGYIEFGKTCDRRKLKAWITRHRAAYDHLTLVELPPSELLLLLSATLPKGETSSTQRVITSIRTTFDPHIRRYRISRVIRQATNRRRLG